MNEKLSALLDDELSDREHDALLIEMSRDPELRGAWERYHMVRAALRNELEIMAPAGLAERIERHLTDEPLVSPRPRIHWLKPRPLLQTAAALAIAASVAAVAVVSLRSSLTPDTPANPLLTAQSPASPQAQGVAQAPGSQRLAQASALDALLVKHGEFSSTAGMNGMMPYVRVVGYNGEK